MQDVNKNRLIWSYGSIHTKYNTQTLTYYVDIQRETSTINWKQNKIVYLKYFCFTNINETETREQLQARLFV